MRWVYPLLHGIKRIPAPGSPGSFGAVRMYDRHTGVDLYCAEGEFVQTVEDGRIVGIEQFTGTAVESPWWHDTWAVLVEGESGVVVYGELESQSITNKIGDQLTACMLIGQVARVLKEDKGLPTTMLHLELYMKGGLSSRQIVPTASVVWWHLRDPKPARLLDPTEFLENSTVFPVAPR